MSNVAEKVSMIENINNVKALLVGNRPNRESKNENVSLIDKNGYAPGVSILCGHAERPKKFTGENFKMWQQKMLFYLTTLNLERFLYENPPEVSEDSETQDVDIIDAWKHGDYLCKNYILNGLDNMLYNVYNSTTNAKSLWESLEKIYKTTCPSAKKFIVGKFLDFKMDDSKTVMSQVHEFQHILHEIVASGMVIGESFQVAVLIEKLPSSWKDFRNYLMHKRKEMNLEELILRLRIEEDYRVVSNKNELGVENRKRKMSCQGQEDFYTPKKAKTRLQRQ